jgi:ubiquinone/menaquinone biosynthesis C-methylase UbiE
MITSKGRKSNVAKEHFALMEIEQIAMLIQASLDAGVLDELLRGPASADELAGRLRLNTRATGLLLDTLVALGYLTTADGRYSASRAFRDLRSDISYNRSNFPEFLQTGRPWMEIDKSIASTETFYTDFFSCIDYAAEMTPAAEAIASRLAGEPDHILDLGAGTGVWSLAMARRSSRTRVTGVDLPAVLKAHFLRRAQELHCRARIDVLEGDFHEVQLPAGAYDRISLGQSFHFVREELAPALIARLSVALRPGGELVMIDHFANDTQSETLSRLLYELRLAMRTVRAKNYSRSAIEGWCRQAGLVPVDYFRVEGPSFLAVLVFRKPTPEPIGASTEAPPTQHSSDRRASSGGQSCGAGLQRSATAGAALGGTRTCVG